MTFEQLFAGRMSLMRAQRHIAQAGISHFAQRGTALYPVFTGLAYKEAFYLIERLLAELESEFDAKKKRRAKRQVAA